MDAAPPGSHTPSYPLIPPTPPPILKQTNTHAHHKLHQAQPSHSLLITDSQAASDSELRHRTAVMEEEKKQLEELLGLEEGNEALLNRLHHPVLPLTHHPVLPLLILLHHPVLNTYD